MTNPVDGHPRSADLGHDVFPSLFADDRPTTERQADSAGRRGAMTAAATVFVLLLAGSLTTLQSMPTTYAATSIVSFTPRSKAMTAADAVQLISQKYAVVATSGTTMQAAASLLGSRSEDLAKAITVSWDAGTGNVEITMERPDRAEAVEAANAVADLLVRRAVTDELVEAETTSPALASRAAVKPARMLLRIAAVLASALTGLLVWTVLRGRSRSRDYQPIRPRPQRRPR
jgi:capsular polysaccharide biosynthesis protein